MDISLYVRTVSQCQEPFEMKSFYIRPQLIGSSFLRYRGILLAGGDYASHMNTWFRFQTLEVFFCSSLLFLLLNVGLSIQRIWPACCFIRANRASLPNWIWWNQTMRAAAKFFCTGCCLSTVNNLVYETHSAFVNILVIYMREKALVLHSWFDLPQVIRQQSTLNLLPDYILMLLLEIFIAEWG
jgi:hypothetical protein